MTKEEEHARDQLQDHECFRDLMRRELSPGTRYSTKSIYKRRTDRYARRCAELDRMSGEAAKMCKESGARGTECEAAPESR